jgi:hypothetical protein
MSRESLELDSPGAETPAVVWVVEGKDWAVAKPAARMVAPKSIPTCRVSDIQWGVVMS